MGWIQKQIPNIITLLNLFFGGWAIVYAFHAGAMALELHLLLLFFNFYACP